MGRYMMQTTTRLRSTSLTRSMRLNQWFSVITSVLTLFFFLSTWYIVPSAHAAGEAVKADRARKQYHPRGRTDEEKLSNTLQDIKERVAERRARVRKRVKQESDLWQGFLNLFGMSRLAKESLDRLDAMAEQAEQLNQKALQGFDAIEQELIDKGLPEGILQRHRATVDKYQAEYRRFRQKLRKAQTAQSLQDQNSALGDLDEYMGKQQFKRRQQPFDPNHLPFGTPDPKKTREPITDPQELNRLLGLNTEPGLIEKVADALSTPAYADPVAGPTPEDLAETIDVQMTDAVRDLADQLDNDPVKIYNWVRNNIDFIPTYGSIQGSDMTLQSKRGNAFDTASLLIALLRAANIPARYAYGKVKIPVERVMNWVGGVEVPEAAIKLLGQGGVPNISIINGGQITHIELEHVWVEAWIDFLPSRGAKNIQGDSWVPMDASFKQFTYSDGIEIENDVQLDFEAYAQSIVDDADIDEQGGSISGLSADIIESELQPFIDEVNLLAETNNITTIGELLGEKVVVPIDIKQLSAGLPYMQNAQIIRFSEFPDYFRCKFKYELFSEGYPVLTITKNTAELVSKDFSLSFTGAKQTDIDLIDKIVFNSNLQTPSLPGYLINVKAKINLDGEVIAETGSFKMGTELSGYAGYYIPGVGWDQKRHDLIAGEYYAIGLDLQGIDRAYVDKHVATIEDIKTKLETNDYNDLKGHSILGKVLRLNLLEYFYQNDNTGTLRAGQAGVVKYRGPSYGFFFTQSRPEYFFGIPRNISFLGLTMDVPSMMEIVVDKKDDTQNFSKFNYLSGLLSSYLESAIPEKFLPRPNQNPVEGVSAVKILALANAAGQRTYAINQSNAATVIPALNLGADVIREIQNAISTGKTVYTHQNTITYAGWTGAGYIIKDEATGSGAYKISGGFNGGTTIYDLLETLKIALGTLLNATASAIVGVVDWIVGCVTLYFECAHSSTNRQIVAGMMATVALLLILFAILLVVFSIVTGGLATSLLFLITGVGSTAFFKTGADVCNGG